MTPSNNAAAIYNNPDHEDGINNAQSYTDATESPFADKWDTAMTEELDAIG